MNLSVFKSAMLMQAWIIWSPPPVSKLWSYSMKLTLFMETVDGERVLYHECCELNLFKIIVQSPLLRALFKGHAEPGKMNFRSPAIKKGSPPIYIDSD